uniref:Ovostatin-like n=1 Tax=Saccoglossus kowalevskii TaxID=10224 RepID=A0ABM0MPQ4_SACKO|nr:PREDICTED: ovostatin-like [Saccoglossus kowalevskii]
MVTERCGDLKFRILSIEGTEFKPYKHMLSTVWIENPSGVRLIQWRNVSTNEGLVELEMPLSEEPILGTWKIKCDMEETIIIQHFDVDEYVLPKFEVDIRPPPFVVINDETIDIKICGRYTYGQPVHGSVHAKVCISPSYSYYRLDRPCAETEKKDTGPDGCADFSIRADSVELKSSYYSIWGKKLNVTASFTEENTDITLNATHDTISIHQSIRADNQSSKKF